MAAAYLSLAILVASPLSITHRSTESGFIMLATLLLAASAIPLPTTGLDLALGQAPQGEAPMIRDYFQAGGQYVENSAREHVFRDQIYVEHLVPMHGVTQKHPIVFLHGSAQTATVSE